MTKKLPRGTHQDLVPDIELWDRVIEAIEPLRTKSLNSPEQPQKSGASKLPFRSASPLPVRPLKSGPPEPPKLTGLDRRTTQKLMRGQVQYEAKLDLHGLGIGEARMQLANFLAAARSQGNRLVLVVTGKGASPFARHTLHGDTNYHVPERQGRLRRLVSDWLHEPEFRHHVSGFQPAHPKHGGGGAYYIRLRRRQTGSQ
jgi:DNA-nicking Smr family endonuclease